jgi:hypothetical protein
MISISNKKQLDEAIHQLERQSAMQEQELRERYEKVITSVTPFNILKTVFHSISDSPELKNSAVNTALGLGTGYVARKLYVGRSAGFLKKIAGSVIQFAVTNFARKKAPIIREKISHLAEK